MNRVVSLLETPLARVQRFDHPRGSPHHDPPEEVAPSHAVNFVEAGNFEVLAGGRRWRLDPTTVFVTHPGLTYRCRHREAQPKDVCLSVLYPSIGEAVKPAARSGGVAVPLTPRLGYLHFRLARWAEGSRERLSGEVIAVELWNALAEHAEDDARSTPPRAPGSPGAGSAWSRCAAFSRPATRSPTPSPLSGGRWG